MTWWRNLFGWNEWSGDEALWYSCPSYILRCYVWEVCNENICFHRYIWPLSGGMFGESDGVYIHGISIRGRLSRSRVGGKGYLPSF